MRAPLYPAANASESPFLFYTPGAGVAMFNAPYVGSTMPPPVGVNPNVTTLTLARVGGFPQPPTLTIMVLNEANEVYFLNYSWRFNLNPTPSLSATVVAPSSSFISPTDTISLTVTTSRGLPQAILPMFTYPTDAQESPFATEAPVTGAYTPTFSSLYSGSTISTTPDSVTYNFVRTGGFPQPPSMLLSTIDDMDNAQSFEFFWNFFPTPTPPTPVYPTPMRALATHTYQVVANKQTFRFDITLDSNGMMAVRNIQGPHGLIQDSYTALPDTVMNGISAARKIMTQQLSEKQVATGTLTFTGQTSQDAAIPSGVLNNTFYRVVYQTPDGTQLITIGQTTTSFTAEASNVYGSLTAPKVVNYVVLVATQQSSDLSGILSFNQASAGIQTVVFPLAMATAKYRVILSPNGFFQATVADQSTTGFTVQLSFTPAVSETVTVGYDVFV